MSLVQSIIEKKYSTVLCIVLLVVVVVVGVLFSSKGGLFQKQNIQHHVKYTPIKNASELLTLVQTRDGSLVHIPKYISLTHKEYEKDASGMYVEKDGHSIEKEVSCFCEITNSNYIEKVTPFGVVKHLGFSITNTLTQKSSLNESTRNDIVWLEKDGKTIIVFGDGELDFDRVKGEGVTGINFNKNNNVLWFTFLGYESGIFVVYDIENQKDIGNKFAFKGMPSGGSGIPQAFAVSDDGKSFAYAESVYADQDVSVDNMINIVYLSNKSEKKVLKEIVLKDGTEFDMLTDVIEISLQDTTVSYTTRHRNNYDDIKGEIKTFFIKM